MSVLSLSSGEQAAVRGEHGNHMNQPSVAQLVALGHNFFHRPGMGITLGIASLLYKM